MSDSPERPNPPTPDPQDPQAAAAAEPTPTSAAPGGLEPSPGIAPPSGMTAPDLTQPEFGAPEYVAPEYVAPEYVAPEYVAPEFVTPEFDQQLPQDPAPPAPQDAAPQFAQDPAPQQYGEQPAAPQFEQQQPQQPQFDQQPYGQDPAAPQYGQQQSFDQQPFDQQQQFPQQPVDPQVGQQQFAQDPAQQQFAAAPGGPGAPAGPGGPGAPGGPDGPNGPKKGLSSGAIIGIVVGAIALVILLVVGGLFAVGSVFKPAASDDKASSATEGKAVKAPKTAQGAVEQFLNAVADGDANTARKVAGGATSDELLTEEALAASLAVAPITNIVVDEAVEESSEYESTVSATFNIGDTTVNRDFKLWKTSNSWELFDGLVSFSLDAFDGLDPQVNGIEMSTGSSIKAFPGAYQISLGLDHFALDSKTDTFVLATRNDADVFYELKPKLTEAATEEYRTLVTESLKKCLESKSFTTPCGLEVSKELSGGEKVVDGTITRTLDTEGEAKLKRLKPESSYSAPTVVSTYDYITVTTTAEVDNAGTRETGTLYGGGSMLTPTVDFAEAEPKVSWE